MSGKSQKIRKQFKKPAIWWGTHVEVNSGLDRLRRDGVLTRPQLNIALQKWDKFYSQAHIIKPEDKILEIASTIPSAHNLRALDSFQLAAALVWCREKPKNRPFICADVRLGKAAGDAGFDIVSLL
jgi:predicted nucleic acid-binding protein